MNTLPQGADYDGRLQTVRRAIVKVNGVIDEDSYSMSRARIRNRPDDVLYKGESLSGTLTNDHWKLFDLEPAGVINQRALFGDPQRFPAGNASRGPRGQETRVPVYSVANGLRGKTPAEIDAQITLLGFTDQTGRQANKSYCNIIIGGVITVINSGPELIRTGDLVMARTPTKEEARNIKARSGDLANTKGAGGRIPYILCPFRPENYDFFNYPLRIKTLGELFEVKGKKIVKKNVTKTLDYVTAQFHHAYSELVDALATFMQGVLPTQEGIDALKSAQEKYEAEVATKATNPSAPSPTAIDRLVKQYGKPEHTPDEALTLAVMYLVAAGRKPYTNNNSAFEAALISAKLMLPPIDRDPLQRMLVALFRFSLNASNKLMGRAMLSAAPGKDFDIMVGHYQR